ncbi:HAD-superfamily subfamily IB hydrolase [Gottschalkia purinilytica]|uniref:phosphoserine phosphatase n=1 Tax=Gottschalkia purinilytica TaxID=1503 RepID=A0A0L0WA98_GOTPU|nr:HAD-IB family hydrolase [Gottschalkia purinilytica]KNF08230.1 HAD-superfamily subfamily IB hydrolase [Gottschalkia purinilytica]
MGGKNIAAFFDIDGTIYRNSLMIEHFKKLIKYEVIDPAIWHNQVKHTYLEWERRYADFEVYLEELAEIYVEQLKGVNKSYIEFIANQVISLNGDKVYKYSRDRIKYHKEKGHNIFFISGSPDFLVSRMAEKYEVTEYRASIYEVDENNNFTGKLKPMWQSERKHLAINELLEKYNVDLENSFAYGDTTGDYSMLKLVGNPIVINPNKELFYMIKDDKELSERIKIMVERKNIIYKLSPSVEIL